MDEMVKLQAELEVATAWGESATRGLLALLDDMEERLCADARYPEMRGYEVLKEDWTHGQDSVNFIAIDGENGDSVLAAAEVRKHGDCEWLERSDERENCLRKTRSRTSANGR